MSLSVGIVGLPNVGKSTLFNALLKRQKALVANYPFATIEPNVGIVPVPDERLGKLAQVVKESEGLTELPPVVESAVEFVDIAGLVSGAHKGEGLGNQFLARIREVQVICHVVRLFSDSDVVQTGSGDAIEDFRTIETELLLADLATIEKQKEPRHSKDRDELLRWKVVVKVREQAEKGKPVREADFSEDELRGLKTLNLLSAKPVLVALNVEEGELVRSAEIEKEYAEKLRVESGQVVAICAKTEAALSELEPSEQEEYLKDLGVGKSGLMRLAQRAYGTLGMLSFFTAGEKECRAWTVRKGMNAQQAAGVIHTDFSENFIKAEVADYDDFVRLNGFKNLREKGRARMEGRDYIVKDGDIILFKVGV